MSRARDFADLAGSASAGGITGRNLIINGAMQVAQRGTSVSGLSTFDKFPCVDRFKLQGASSGTFTISQSTTAPEGFSNSLKFDCTTADSSPNYLLIMQRIEGQNVQHLKKGTSNALSTTVSFYVRSSKTGTYQFNIRDNDNSRLIGSTYTINSADTWERKTLTFAGDTSGTLDNDNGDSLRLEWWLAAGSTYNSGAVPTAWEALSNGDRAAGLTVNIGASTDDDFYLTGVQLEVGSVTPFEHRPYADELLKCERYFSVVVGSDVTFTNTHAWTTQEVIGHLAVGKVEMRANPTMSHSGNNHFFIRSGGISETTDNVSFVQADKRGHCRAEFSGSGGLTAGRGAWVKGLESAGYIHADAEL